MRNKVLILFIIFFTPFFHLYAVAKSAEKPSSRFLLDEIWSIPILMSKPHPKEKPLSHKLMNSRQLGLEVNAASKWWGETPLLILIQRFPYFPKRRLGFKNKDSLLATLLNHPDVDLDAVNMFGYTALIKAIKLGQTDIALALLEKGASPNAVTDKNHYYGLYHEGNIPRVVPLIEAVRHKNYAVVHALMTNKATDINASDEEGHTVFVSEEYKGSKVLGISKDAGTFQHPITITFRKRSPSLFKRCTNLLAN